MKAFKISSRLVKFILVLTLTLVSVNGYTQVLTDFSPRYSNSLNGDMLMIANDVLSENPPTSYNGEDVNNNLFQQYVDIDSDPLTFNSSRANLANPIGGGNCPNIVGAYLYWAANDREYDANNGNGQPEPDWDFNRVQLMMPGQSSYITLNADDVIYNGRAVHFSNDPYACVKDITNLVKDLDNPYGNYQVANVKAAAGNIQEHGTTWNSGAAGGWQIIFIYEDAGLPRKNITLFDGFVNVTGGINSQFNVNGFQTVTNGPVRAKVHVSAIEGDRNNTGDQIQILDTEGDFVALSTDNRDGNDFFTSRISIDGDDFVDRFPASTNTLGFDAALFELRNSGNRLIDNGQTSATFNLTTNTETYQLYTFGLSIESFEPNFNGLSLTSTSATNSFSPGDTIPVELKVDNIGNDDAENLEIRTTLPQQVEFVNTGTLPAGVTQSYNAVNRELLFTIADDIIEVLDEELTIPFNLSVSSSCAGCDSNFEIQVTATYNGDTNQTQGTALSSSSFTDCGLGNEDPTQFNIIPSVSINDANGTEGDILSFTVTASHILNDDQTLNITYTDGTANSQDFSTTTSAVTIPAGSKSATFDVLALDDSLIEIPSESFVVTINTTPSSSITIADADGTGTIIDNDLIDGVGIELNDTNLTLTEGVNATTTLTVNFLGTRAPGEDVAVDYVLNSNTANSGVDFGAQSGTLTFENGSNSVNFDISILNDMEIEDVEDFTILFSNVQSNLGVGFADGNATNVMTITINDDDLDAVDDATTFYHVQLFRGVRVLGNDSFGNTTPANNALQIVSGPTNGAASVNNNGTPADPTDDYLNYEPNSPTFIGTDTITYSITNTLGTTDTATITINLSDAEVRAPFEIRYQGAIKGDFTTIANNVLSRNATAAYNGNEDNHDFDDNVFVDIDNNPNTFNSTSANFDDLGLGCETIVRAYLYWAAANRPYNDQNGNGGVEPNWNFNDVMLKLPGETNYTTITADEIIFNGRPTNFENNPYICIKEITDDVNALNNPFGTYQIANVKATEGKLTDNESRTGVSGGWQIVFVYEDESLNKRNITLYDGYAHVSREIGSTQFDFYGFETVTNGDVNANILLGSLEGDRNIDGDQLQILNTNSNFTNLSTSLRNSNNFFNSRITIDGTDYINRNPASTNTLGYDVALFDLENTGNLLIGNNQTNTSLVITSTQDTYGVYLMGMSVEGFEPSLGALSLSADSGTYNPGDIVPIDLEVNNIGNDDILNLSISTFIPNDVEFVDAASLPNGVTYNYNSETRELVFQVADGFTDMGNSYNIAFELQVKEQCHFLESTCASSFQFQATASYTGEISGDTFTELSSGSIDECGDGVNDPTIISINQPDQVNWSTPQNDLDRTLTCTDSEGLTNALALAPTTEFCSFTLVKTTGEFVPASPDCLGTGTYTNTWVFTDACGRTSEVFTQTITIEDNVAPNFNESLPLDTFAAYDNIPTPIDLTASDICDANPTVNLTETYIGDNSSTTYTIVRTWVASDCSGNETIHSRRIFVTENGEPIGVSINNVVVNEADGTATLQLIHVGKVLGGFTVAYEAADAAGINPATATEDYTPISGLLSFTGDNGEILNLDIPIIDDNIIETLERFIVLISNGTNTPVINTPSGEVSIIDNDGGNGTGISFDNDSITVNEADGTVTINVVLTGNVQGGFTLDFTTNDGSANNPEDYTLTSGTLTFEGNDGEIQTITVPINDDLLIENNENFTIDLSDLSTDLIGINEAQANVTIIDNDGGDGTGISFDNTEVIVNEDAGTATFTVTLTGDVSEGFTLDYTTTDGSAIQPDDYILTSGSLTFEGVNGESYEIVVPITDDLIIESTEGYTLNLSNLSTDLININTPQANGGIIDNDGIDGTGISFDNTEVIVFENDGTAIFIVTLTGDVSGGFTLDYATTDGSAIQPDDYISTSGTLTFEGINGESYEIVVPITDDLIIEDTEGYTLNLSNLSIDFLTINTPQANGGIIDDDLREIMSSNYNNNLMILCGDEIPEIPELTFTNGCGEYEVEFTQAEETSDTTDDFIIVRTWMVTDACNNTGTFEQIIMVMQLEKEFYTIDICVEDPAIDLASFLPENFDTTGNFSVIEGFGNVNGSFFNPNSFGPGEFVISYLGQDGSCNFLADFTINVNTECVECGLDEVEVSTALTPNGDGFNDSFEIKANPFCYFEFNVMIFNRWGDKVFEETNYQNDWSGISPSGSFGNNGALPSGTYYYIISVNEKPEVGSKNGFFYLGTN